jgi:Rab-like protein 2
VGISTKKRDSVRKASSGFVCVLVKTCRRPHLSLFDGHQKRSKGRRSLLLASRSLESLSVFRLGSLFALRNKERVMNQAYYEGEESQTQVNNEHIISPDENNTTSSSSSSNEQIQNSNGNNNNNIDNTTIDEPDIKIIIIGDSAVGKSKLLERYLINDYNPRRLSTHALTLYRKNVTLGNNNNNNKNNKNNNSNNSNEEETIKVDFWDTAGQEKFHSLHPTYYYRAHACILVFDVTRKSTYHNLQKWYDELLQYSSSGRTATTTIPCILVANKVDINYDVTKKSFKFASDHHMPFFFVSSADGTNVVKVFEEAICMALGQKRYGERDFLSECLELLDDGPLKLNE